MSPSSPELTATVLEILARLDAGTPQAVVFATAAFQASGTPQASLVFRVLTAMLLVQVEENPEAFQAALAVAEISQDPWVFQAVRDVVEVRANGEMIRRVNESSFVRREPAQVLNKEPWIPVPRPTALSMEDAERALVEQGYRVLQVYATPTPGAPYQRYVALALAPNGDLELVKAVTDETGGPLGIQEIEHGVVMDLEFRGHRTGTSSFLGFLKIPTDSGDRFLMRRSFAYGRLLSDASMSPGVPSGVACRIVRNAARNLKSLHDRRTLFLDWNPNNVLEDGTLFDLGNARRLGPLSESVPTYVMDPLYAAPEVILHRQASMATDIYGLGVLFHYLLTGDSSPFFADGSSTFDGLRDAAMTALGTYEREDLPNILSWMLTRDPAKRPTVEDVLRWFDSHPETVDEETAFRGVPWMNNGLALLPMRAAVPHNGHINLLCRVMDLGFRPLVSLAMSYTWTDRDPVPKWEVMEMIKAAVTARGYDASSLVFMLTPYEDEAGQRFHYLMSPWWDQVSIIVSGNPEVYDLLAPVCGNRPIVSSDAICGDLTDAVGTTLRTAMATGDQATVDAMLPPVIAQRWPDLVEKFFPKKGDILVSGPVKVRVQGGDRNPVSVLRYETPEQTLRRHFPSRAEWTYDRLAWSPGHTELTIHYR